VWVRVSFAGDFADAPRARVDEPGNLGALPPGWDELPQPLDPADLLVTKRQWGAFYGTDLDLQLRRRGLRTIVLGGIATSIGVESTARSAWEHGYELVICEDLCADLSAETHGASFRHIFPRLARVSSSEAITLE
jgi:nicotinamidase-related amidase